MKGTTVPSEEEKGCWGRFNDGVNNVCCSQDLKQSDNQETFEDVELDQIIDRGKT